MPAAIHSTLDQHVYAIGGVLVQMAILLWHLCGNDNLYMELGCLLLSNNDAEQQIYLLHGMRSQLSLTQIYK